MNKYTAQLSHAVLLNMKENTIVKKSEVNRMSTLQPNVFSNGSAVVLI
jgi:hypothetical protein